LRIIPVVLAAVVILLWLLKYWTDTNSKDMGTMSTQWLAENNSSSRP
jgi:hypothetical protein